VLTEAAWPNLPVTNRPGVAWVRDQNAVAARRMLKAAIGGAEEAIVGSRLAAGDVRLRDHER